MHTKKNQKYGVEIINTKEVMGKFYMFQSRFGKLDKFGWWVLEEILAYASSQFASTEFQEGCQTRGVHLTLADTDSQEINGQVKVI